jgi:branched-chain amino acid transport system substrate-binding protein
VKLSTSSGRRCRRGSRTVGRARRSFQMQRMRIALFGVVLVALSAACAPGQSRRPGDAGPQPEHARAALAYRIGVAGPMTGDYRLIGLQFQRGVQLAVRDWLAANPGLHVEVIVGDDQRDPKQAVAAANRFVKDGVLGVVGHFNSSCSIPASTIYQEAGLVQITPASTNPRLTDRGHWNVFRTIGRDDLQGSVAADFIAKRGIRRVAIVDDQTPYATGIVRVLEERLREHGVEVVFADRTSQGRRDFSALLGEVAKADPELVFYGGIYPEAGLLTKQMTALGIKARFMGGDGLFDPEFVKIAGKEAAEGTWLTFAPRITNVPTAKKVVEAYERQFGGVGEYVVNTYAAAMILLDALKAVGATSPKDNQRVAEYIRQTAWETALGTLRFDHKGDLREPRYAVYEVRNGTSVQITGLP